MSRKERPSAMKAVTSAANGLRGGRPKYDERTREQINEVRIRGARSLPAVIDNLVLIATTGYSRYVSRDGKESFQRVEPETMIYAARFIGDRCGLPVRNETEVSTGEDMGPVVIRFFGPE